jgi:hypothetical protein
MKECKCNECEGYEEGYCVIDVFEYSVFGSPQQKIGDFTQTKIGGFS